MNFQQSPGTSIYYERTGSGPFTLVLLHGLGTSAETWRDILPLLETSAELVILDNLGVGRSSKPADGRYSPDDHAGNVAALIRYLDLRNVVLVGNSYGGTVLPYAAARIPERIRGAVYIDPAVYPQAVPLPIRLLTLPVIPLWFAWLVPVRVGVRIVMRDAFFDRSRITPDRVERHARFAKVPGGVRPLHLTARAMLSAQDGRVADKAREIRTPMLVIWGAQDRVTPASSAELFRRDFPTARIHIIPNCGHAPQEECPEATAALIQAFLRDLEMGLR